MDEVERLALEREIREHSAAVEELSNTLNELEAEIGKQATPSESLQREIDIIRSAIRGRMAAISLAEARLGVNPF